MIQSGSSPLRLPAALRAPNTNRTYPLQSFHSSFFADFSSLLRCFPVSHCWVSRNRAVLLPVDPSPFYISLYETISNAASGAPPNSSRQPSSCYTQTEHPSNRSRTSSCACFLSVGLSSRKYNNSQPTYGHGSLIIKQTASGLSREVGLLPTCRLHDRKR